MNIKIYVLTRKSDGSKFLVWTDDPGDANIPENLPKKVLPGGSTPIFEDVINYYYINSLDEKNRLHYY